ncbi:putative protein S-acyltransferase 7 [Diplonema papillatum]|nr:putative protein S-acyltransferase 7 [Diplonema papillatum]
MPEPETSHRVDLWCCRASPCWKRGVAVAAVFAAPCAVFAVFVALRSPLLLGGTGGLLFLVAASLFYVVFADPGVVRPSLTPLCNVETAPVRTHCTPRRDVAMVLNDVLVKRKWCSTCNLLRPLRAAHCSECNVCIEEMDHHCGVLGACVGKNNRAAFALFLWAAVLLCVWILAWCLFFMVEKASFRRHFNEDKPIDSHADVAAVLLIIFTFTYLPFVDRSVMYCWLATRGLTLREYIKYQTLYPGTSRSPFASENCLVNCWWVTTHFPPPHAVVQSNEENASSPEDDDDDSDEIAALL